MSEPWAAAVETATASVFFAGELAAKLKKPTDFGYADFSTLDARRRACEREVEVNRRLAPDVYLGVADLVGPAGDVIDHLVLMHRMPASRRLSALLHSQRPAQLRRRTLPDLARLLAGFHGAAHVVSEPDGPGSHPAVCRLWEEGLSALDRVTPSLVDAHVSRGISSLGRRYLAGRRPLFDQRLADGLVRDGHGDLLADDIFVLDDGARVLDALEFDERLRVCDVWMDVAFLAMDLERLGHPRLADAFLQAYAERAGNEPPSSLRHFFIAYRALVRIKVAALRFDQGDPAAAVEAKALAALCLRHLRKSTVTLTLVGGLPGSGKTTLATSLAEALDARYLSSDVVRKELDGSRPTTSRAAPWRRGIYDDVTTRRTYAEVLRRAAQALESGQSVILDATWWDAAQRDRAREVADCTQAVLTETCCAVAERAARERLARRRGAASDADAEVRRRMAQVFADWPQAVLIHTDRAPGSVRSAAAAVRRSVRRAERQLGTLASGRSGAMSSASTSTDLVEVGS